MAKLCQPNKDIHTERLILGEETNENANGPKGGLKTHGILLRRPAKGAGNQT